MFKKYAFIYLTNSLHQRRKKLDDETFSMKRLNQKQIYFWFRRIKQE